MTRPYSNDLRERVVGAVERGELSCRQAAAHYGVGISTAIKWVQRLRRTGSVSPSKIGGYRPKKLIGSWRLWLLERCRGGDFTLRGLVAELAERGLKVDYRVVWAFVHAEQLSHKKDADRQRTGPPRCRAPACAVAALSPSDRSVAPGVHRRDLDQANMAPLRGWAPRGERLKAKVPHRRWKTMTFLAALRLDRVEAPWLIDGPINGERFRLYVEKVLLPTLRPDDLVVIDNLGSHRGKAIRRIIRSVGAKLFFLPKYSPDLNPIEQLFAKLKHWLRNAAGRSVDAVSNAIGHILGTVTTDECANYFANAGYKPA